MSMYSRIATIWKFAPPETVPEPLRHIPLKDCTSEQLDAKIEFLMRRNELLKNEKDALEMYAIKTKPELMNTYNIDVSWMPYNLNVQKPKFVNQVSKVMDDIKGRISVLPTPVNKSSESGSMSSAVLTMMESNISINHLSINHLAFMVQNVLKFAKADFKKRYDEITERKKELETEIENLEDSRRQIVKNAENFRKEILEAAYDRMTKRIPAEKYERFAKKRSTDGATLLNNLRVKTARAKKELKTLRAEYEVLMEKQGKITVNDCKLAQMKNQELFRKLGEAQQLMDEMKVYKNDALRDFNARKRKMDIFERSLNLHDMNIQIRRLKNTKIDTVVSNEKLTEENLENGENNFKSKDTKIYNSTETLSK